MVTAFVKQISVKETLFFNLITNTDPPVLTLPAYERMAATEKPAAGG
jgi:hypothetical protein